MAGPYQAALLAALWPPRTRTDVGVWAILDGARDPRVFPTVRASALSHTCLYTGRLPRELQLAAPYLVELDPAVPSTGRMLDLAWGNSWGVFLRVDGGPRLRHHLRGFLRVKSDRGANLIFRYYDPRVLRAYLPTCLPTELKSVFGPIGSFVMEDEDPQTLIEASFDGRKLTERRVSLGGAGAS